MSICGRPPSTSHSVMSPRLAVALVLPWSLFLKIQCTCPVPCTHATPRPRHTVTLPTHHPSATRAPAEGRQPPRSRRHRSLPLARALPSASPLPLSPLMRAASAPLPPRGASLHTGREASGGGAHLGGDGHELVVAKAGVEEAVDKGAGQVGARRVHHCRAAGVALGLRPGTPPAPHVHKNKRSTRVHPAQTRLPRASPLLPRRTGTCTAVLPPRPASPAPHQVRLAHVL